MVLIMLIYASGKRRSSKSYATCSKRYTSSARIIKTYREHTDEEGNVKIFERVDEEAQSSRVERGGLAGQFL